MKNAVVKLIASIVIILNLFLLPNPTTIFAQTAHSGVCVSAVGQVSEALRKLIGCEAPVDKNISVAPGGSSGPCQAAPPPPSDIRAAIIAKWGITLNITQGQLPWAWKEFFMIDCRGFLQAIRGTVVGSWSNGYAQQFSCPSDGDVDVMFSDQWEGDYMGAILSHELTHVWQNCTNKGEQNRLLIPNARAQEGGLTNYGRTGCSFNVDLVNEDHADTIALWMNPDVGELTCGNGAPNPYQGGRYPAHRNVAVQGVGQ